MTPPQIKKEKKKKNPKQRNPSHLLPSSFLLCPAKHQSTNTLTPSAKPLVATSRVSASAPLPFQATHLLASSLRKRGQIGSHQRLAAWGCSQIRPLHQPIARGTRYLVAHVCCRQTQVADTHKQVIEPTQPRAKQISFLI